MDISIVECGAVADASSVLLIVPDKALSEEAARVLTQDLARKFKTYVVTSSLPAVDQVIPYVEQLIGELEARKIKRVTAFGIGPGGTIPQALAVFGAKLVRRIVLLEATTRLEPGVLLRMIDRIEAFLPLGLPMRSLTNEFDSRPLLHRVHCPTLVVATKSSNSFITEQANVLAHRIPNSWLATVDAAYRKDGLAFGPEIVQLVEEFLQVPVKRPQKGTATLPAAA